jgi:hypothetical protein
MKIIAVTRAHAHIQLTNLNLGHTTVYNEKIPKSPRLVRTQNFLYSSLDAHRAMYDDAAAVVAPRRASSHIATRGSIQWVAGYESAALISTMGR